MKETGVVFSVKDDRAEVQVKRTAQCDKCGMCVFPKNADFIKFNCINKVGAKVGDKVELSKENQNKMISYLLIFLVPLLLIGASALIGILVIKIDYWVLILCAITLSIWFLALFIIDKAIKKCGKLSPVITKVIDGQNDIEQKINDVKGE